MGRILLNDSVARPAFPAESHQVFPEYRPGPGDLPPEAPLDMPVQSFDRCPEPRRQVVTSPEGIADRRRLLILGALTIGLIAALGTTRPLREDGTDLLDAATFLLFLSLFCWISFGFLNALAGFIGLRFNAMAPLIADARLPRPRRRTAVLVPIYNENVDELLKRLRAMTAMVGEAGGRGLFDFFILSDSHAQREAREYRAFRQIRQESPVPVYYRRRPRNVARKPGNIAEWVRRFGGAYDYMIILDADSLMSGRAMMQLASVMDRAPGIGLVQTIPTVINARTPFARWQQFAASAYGTIAGAGLTWWSGAEATFWGHNAIVRVRAFAESCGLPELPGREPMGGHIMSHDMVEAALLRRRGWAVHMVSLPEGSHEEFPPTLSDLAVRDRRWCQGNLQHLRLLRGAGLHWVNRLQLLMGASAYLTSPLWLILIALSLLEPLGLVGGPALRLSGWPLILTAILLFGPKLMSLAWLRRDPRQRAALGGGRAIARSVLAELALSILVAPVAMLTQSMAIIDIARGRPSGWQAQRRDADGIPLLDAALACRWHVALGALFLAASVAGGGHQVWMAPIIAGLLLSPLTMSLTSRRDLGDWLAARGIFATADDSPAHGAPAPASPPVLLYATAK